MLEEQCNQDEQDALTTQNEQPQEQNVPQKSMWPAQEGESDQRILGSVYEGFVGALFSTIMGVAAAFFTLMMGTPMNVIAEMLSMYGFILGVRAVRTYNDSKLWQQAKPTATRVLGIIGVVINSLVMVFLLFWIIAFFILFVK